MRFEYRPLETQPRATTSTSNHTDAHIQELEPKIAIHVAEITNLKTKIIEFETSLKVTKAELTQHKEFKDNCNNGTRPAGSACPTCGSYKH